DAIDAPSRSRVSRATFVSWRAADELRGRTACGAIRLLRAVFRRCALAGPPPALERRRIVAPRLRTRHLGLAWHIWKGLLGVAKAPQPTSEVHNGGLSLAGRRVVGVQSWDRVKGTNRTKIVECIRVSLGAIFSITVSCCGASVGPSGMTSRPPTL